MHSKGLTSTLTDTKPVLWTVALSNHHMYCMRCLFKPLMSTFSCLRTLVLDIVMTNTKQGKQNNDKTSYDNTEDGSPEYVSNYIILYGFFFINWLARFSIHDPRFTFSCRTHSLFQLLLAKQCPSGLNTVLIFQHFYNMSFEFVFSLLLISWMLM